MENTLSPRLTAEEQTGYLPRQIRWVLLLRVILFSLLLGINSLLQPFRHELGIPPLLLVFIFIITIFLFSIGSEFLLRRIRSYKNFAYFQVIADSFFVSLIVFYTGASNSIFPILYFFPVISGGILLHKIGGLTLASINTILYGIVLFNHLIPMPYKLPSSFQTGPFPDINAALYPLSFYGLSFFLVALLSSILSERFSMATERLSKTAEDLKSLNQLYKQIFDDINSGIITVDSQNHITSFNNAAEGITGYRQYDVIWQNIRNFFPELHTEGVDTDRSTAVIAKKNKKKIEVGYSWAKLNMPNERKDSKVYTIQDLSKIKTMEAKVQQAEKMAAIGEIAAGIAHEFRNPLAAISGATQILVKEPNQTDTSNSLLKIINRESSRLEKNINDFLLFSRPAKPEKTWINIATILEECVAVIKQSPSFTTQCKISYNIPQNLDCWADHHQLGQVLINLIHNASVSIVHSQGTIEISAFEETDRSDNENTVITIKDSGIGMDKETIDNIFEPFFTTRENGTGLGLAIVKQIIISHNGQIKLDSVLERGTEVTIKLPLP